jgi:hypothetical protein
MVLTCPACTVALWVVLLFVTVQFCGSPESVTV